MTSSNDVIMVNTTNPTSVLTVTTYNLMTEIIGGDSFGNNSRKSMKRFEPVNTESWLPLLIVSIMIILENGFLICAFIKGKQTLLKASSGVLLCNQAVSDLLNGILFLPTVIAERLSGNSAVSPFVNCYIFYISLFSLCLLALDRFLSIVRPINHRIYFRETSLFKLVASVWILPLILTLIPFFWIFKPQHEQKDAGLIYFALLWVIMALFSMAMIILYTITFKRVKMILSCRNEDNTSMLMNSGRSTSMTKKLAKKELRLTKLFCSLLLVFILSYIPIITTNLIILAGKQIWATPFVMEFALYAFVSSSLINPLLCVWMQTKLRKQIIELITCKKTQMSPNRLSSSNVTFVASRSKCLSDENGYNETTA